MLRRLFEERQKEQWQAFLRARWEVITMESGYETMATHEIAYDLVYTHLAPVLTRAGYVFKCSKDDFVGCLLNYMYRCDSNYWHGAPSTYRCAHANCRTSSDMEEHFYSRKLPPHVWDAMRKQVGVAYWADDDEFAAHFWGYLPHIVFVHIDFVNSNATHDLQDLLRYEGEEEDSTPSKKKEIDPYLLDYYGGKYKKQLESGGT
jgi:hypothetical protein